MARSPWAIPNKESGNGNDTVSWTANPHTGREARQTTATFAASGVESKILTIIQSGKTEFVSFDSASAAFVKRGDFGITFFSGDFTDNCVTVQVRPVDTTAAEAVTFRFTWDGADYKGNPTYKMEPGKYYVLHPDAVTELEGLFALEFAEWSCGME